MAARALFRRLWASQPDDGGVDARHLLTAVKDDAAAHALMFAACEQELPNLGGTIQRNVSTRATFHAPEVGSAPLKIDFFVDAPFGDGLNVALSAGPSECGALGSRVFMLLSERRPALLFHLSADPLSEEGALASVGAAIRRALPSKSIEGQPTIALAVCDASQPRMWIVEVDMSMVSGLTTLRQTLLGKREWTRVELEREVRTPFG
ncbi:MAG: hypothetical protein ACYCXZ_03900 [Coriobacteriia bacterium]